METSIHIYTTVARTAVNSRDDNNNDDESPVLRRWYALLDM